MTDLKEVHPTAATIGWTGAGAGVRQASTSIFKNTTLARRSQLDIFAEIKRSVKARACAEMYGLHPDRHDFVSCPFHQERTASLKLFPDGGWKCFGCGRGGDSIDFVRELFDLSPLQTVQKMNTDFMLGLELDKPPDAEAVRAAQRQRKVADTYNRFERWRAEMLQQLNACFREGHIALQALEDPADLDKLTDAQALAIREQVRFEWLAEVLTDGTMAEQMEVFRGRGRIGQLCEKILSNTQMKSAAA